MNAVSFSVKFFTSKGVHIIYALDAKVHTGSIWDKIRLEVHIENGVKIVLKRDKQKTLPPPPPQNPPVVKLRLFRK